MANYGSGRFFYETERVFGALAGLVRMTNYGSGRLFLMKLSAFLGHCQVWPDQTERV